MDYPETFKTKDTCLLVYYQSKGAYVCHMLASMFTIKPVLDPQFSYEWQHNWIVQLFCNKRILFHYALNLLAIIS